ncbi:ABC transporter ATP-binding protein [Bradyrhizobium canariense]|uniref:NitT/TauT family transport system ATP-binding protein n=1 Tax=Bradyrhizobium canariense TaxID=255045 RepID=A0A1H1SJY1_9BRAD|nr:ABC transporter ATP-binding protein [Bradyrhizobium canariense]SDS48330.1 NitT/TauT family transport system ATP-binding protein [Bradyrhizobium canariense]
MRSVLREAVPRDLIEDGRQRPADAHIIIDSVSKIYCSDRGEVEALRDIRLKIRPGAFVSIVGPSGCGKSTLMRCIAGLERPSTGGVVIGGREIDAPPQNLGMVFQRDVLLEWRTVLDNVLLLIELRRGHRSEWVARARQLLDVFGLESFHDCYPWELSGGMRQRVSICRAMLSDPDILLMDEPFAALDAFTRDDLNLELQATSQRTKATTIFITHNISEAIFLADQVVVMDRRPGRVALVIDIHLPRPRPLAVKESPEFAEYGRLIRKTFEDLGILRRGI